MSDRLDAPGALAESEARYRSLVEACPEPIVVHARGVIRFVNPAALDLLGARDAAEVVGRPMMDFVHPEFHAVVAERVKKMLETGGPAYLLEEKILRLDGSVRDVEIAGGRVAFQGEPAIQLVGRDVTERRRAAEEKSQLEERMREARRRESLYRLAKGVAHELQQLSAELIETVDASVAEMRPISGRRLAAVRRVGQRMRELTEQLQGFTGKRRSAGTLVDLSSLVLELSERLDSEVGAVNLGFDLPTDLPRVRADVLHLRRSVTLLVRNAADAMGPGGGNVVLRTRSFDADAAALAEFHPEESLAPGAYVALEVRDTGCGMDEATRSRILDPFFSTKAPGRGLGLAEVLGLVGTCGGGIRVESAPGRGTTVTVILPVPPPDSLDEARRRKKRAP
jgi:PAS domain S-box-containing protein